MVYLKIFTLIFFVVGLLVAISPILLVFLLGYGCYKLSTIIILREKRLKKVGIWTVD